MFCYYLFSNYNQGDISNILDMKLNKQYLIILFLLSICYGQLGVGDTIPTNLGLPVCANEPYGDFMLTNDSLFLHAYNGATNSSGSHYVIWLHLFTSWCGICQTEAPITQEAYESYQDSGLVIVGAGYDWGSPYDCEGWAEGYALTYPLLDDEGEDQEEGDENFFNLFGAGFIPHNIIINHEMEIVYSQAGFDPSAIETAITEAFDYCGELCAEPWNPECNEILGELDNTYTMDNEPIINIIDLVKLSDIVALETEIDECVMISGDLSGDGIIDIIDIYALASMLSNGDFDN